MFKNKISFLLTVVFFGAAFLQAAQVFGQTCTPAPVGLVSFFAADNNALDSRSRNNGTLQGGATFAAGKVGQAFQIPANSDGSSGVNVPDSPSLNFTTALSVEAWVNPSTPNTSVAFTPIVDKGFNNGGSPNTYLLNFDPATGKVAFIIGAGGAGNATIAISVNPIPLNTYTYVVGTYDGTTVRLYINGVLDASQAGTISSLAPSGTGLAIGRSAGFLNAFYGAIDEVSLYNRTLSASEIQAIFNSGSAGKCKPTATVAPSGQVAWLAGDGNPNDLSGNGNNGTLQSGVGFAVGKVGQTLTFDGTANGFVKINASPTLDVGTSNGLTIETWVRPTQISTAQILVEWNNNSGASGIGAHLALSSTIGGPAPGNVSANLIDTSGTFHFIESAGGLTTTNAYQHVAVTYDKTTGNANLFLNGAVVATQNLGIFTPRTNSDLYLGKRISTNNFFFSGGLDETSIYNRALSADEITSIVNAGLAGKLKQTTTSGTTATVGDATVTFSSSATRTTQEIPLDKNLFPALPMGTNTGLVYDVAADANVSNPTVCFNLPSFTSAQFPNLRIYHFESGAWQNRTASMNTYPTLCTSGLTSLSPFAIGLNVPTAASVSIGGQAMTSSGRGIRGVIIRLTDANGNVRTATTTSFGYYRFENVSAGETYIITATSRRFTFSQQTQVLNINEDIEGVNFIANDGVGFISNRW